MDTEVLAEWLRRQGHGVARTTSTWWCESGPRVWQAFPFHWCISPSEDELRTFLRQTRAIGLRYSTELDAPEGVVSYHIVYASKRYEMEQLPKKARYDVRKGLSYARIEPIPFSRLATEGWALRAETLARQGRTAAETQESWERLCLSAADLPSFETWGAVHEEQLVAALLAFTLDDCCSILYQLSATAHQKWGVNNALTYAFTNEALSRSDVLRMFYGLHSLDAPASVDDFKLRMGYVAKPVRQRVVFHPLLAPLFNRATYAVVRQLVRLFSANPALAKTEGMMRFYLAGKLPANQQSLPQALSRIGLSS
ncbi:MAG: hypothetical protein M1305_00885 [Candidatus Marsarchaeota archaeon]|nr:hypothetical protein [Candidatus Marsarchaeota archaeon]